MKILLYMAKGTFADVIKFKDLKIDILDYLARPGAIVRFLKSGMGPWKKSQPEWSNMRRTQHSIAGFENGRGHEPRNVESFRKLEKARQGILLYRDQMRTQLCQIFDFRPVRPMPDFELQNSKVMCLYNFKPPSL